MQSSPRIAEARTQIVNLFLNQAVFTDAEWLLTIDADMEWEPDAVEHLFKHADPVKAPIVGGLCFAGMSPDRCYPTLYKMEQDDDGIALSNIDFIPDAELIKVGATGAAFVLIHRKVLLSMAKAYGTLPNGRPNPYPYYAEGHVDRNGRAMGEDIVFCIRAQALGFPVHVAPAAEVGHFKNITLTREVWETYGPH
jgi:GT2 family glycosyltransferase